VTVRPATEADIDAIADSEEHNLGADAWSPGLVAEGVRGALPTVHYLVAEDDGEVVGHAVASVVDDLVELQRIAVAPASRRTGVASALLDAVVALPGARVLLEVREDNDGALGFYSARGFVELARRPRYYRDGSTAIVMELT
jgi:ribosomal-protein-alanine N-acetyltransferase